MNKIHLNGRAASMRRRFFSISTLPFFVRQPITTPLQGITGNKVLLHSNSLTGENILHHHLHLLFIHSSIMYFVLIVIKITSTRTNDYIHRNVQSILHGFYNEHPFSKSTYHSITGSRTSINEIGAQLNTLITAKKSKPPLFPLLPSLHSVQIPHNQCSTPKA